MWRISENLNHWPKAEGESSPGHAPENADPQLSNLMWWRKLTEWVIQRWWLSSEIDLHLSLSNSLFMSHSKQLCGKPDTRKIRQLAHMIPTQRLGTRLAACGSRHVCAAIAVGFPSPQRGKMRQVTARRAKGLTCLTSCSSSRRELFLFLFFLFLCHLERNVKMK